MLPKTHFLLGAIFSILIWPFIGANSLIVLVSSVLIDFDHYLMHVINHRDFSLKNAYNYLKEYPKEINIKNKEKLLCIFHTFEFFIFLWVLALFSKYAFFMLLGSSFHLFLDILAFGNEAKSVSIIQHFLKKRKII